MLTSLAFSQGKQMHTHYADHPGLFAGIDDMVRLAGLPIELGNTDMKFILHHCKSLM
jgi:hypothetical protein